MDSYISTIGVDFVSLSYVIFVFTCIFLLTHHGLIAKCFWCLSENQNYRAGWEDYQAADCELTMFCIKILTDSLYILYPRQSIWVILVL